MVFGAIGEPDTLDSMNTVSNAALVAAFQMQETLVALKPGTLDIVPALAEWWEPNDDSTTWTFTLRTDIVFHDGTPLNAEAVIFNFRRMADPIFDAGYRSQGNTFPAFPTVFGGFIGEESSIWESVEAIDEKTVVFNLTQPTPLFPHYIAAPYFGISSPQAIETVGADYGTPDVGAVGTGPFVFDHWQPGEHITFKRNEQYWGKPAKAPSITIQFISDAEKRLKELQAGTIDFTVNLSPDAYTTIAEDPALEIAPVESFSIAFLAPNLHNKPLDNVLIRQAMAYAIDREAILKEFYNNTGTVAVDFLPNVLAWARPETLNSYTYNPEQAKALLTEAGYPNGLDTITLQDGTQKPLTLWYLPMANGSFPEPQRIAEVIAASFAEAGMNVQVQTEAWDDYLDHLQTGDKYGVAMLSWIGDYSDPNNFLLPHFGAGNVTESGYYNQELVDLLKQAATAKTQQEAATLFQQAGIIINHDVPRIPLLHAAPVHAKKKTLQGWVPSPVNVDSFAPVFLEE